MYNICKHSRPMLQIEIISRTIRNPNLRSELGIASEFEMQSCYAI